MPQSIPFSTTPWHQRASVWLGIGINPASISTGGGIAMLIPQQHLVWVLPLGVFLLMLLSISQGLLGQQRRQRLGGLAADTFGTVWGARALNLLMALGLIGWSGFHGGVSGASTAQLFGLPDWVGALLIIALLYLLTIAGINRWAALTWVTTGAALALTIFALATVDLSVNQVLSSRTATSHRVSVTDLLWAIGMIIGYATLFSLRTADFTWDFGTKRDVIKANLFFVIPLLFSMGVGALLYWATGNWNIADVLAQAQSPALGHTFLLVAVISPLISGWYSGALALSHLTPLTPHQSTLLICLLGIPLAAIRFDQQLLLFLGYLGASLGPALVVMLLANRIRPRPTTRSALFAWLIGAIIAMLFHAQGHPLALFAGAGVSGFVLGGLWMFRKQRTIRS